MRKFSDPTTTANGKQRAFIQLQTLRTLWFNTGTLCNLACPSCYIKSSPRNDRLQFLTPDDVKPYLNEIKRNHWPTQSIGLTGGEPFVNPHIIQILQTSLSQGFKVLVLTNGYRSFTRHRPALLELASLYPKNLSIRVSLDHWSKKLHEKKRGPHTFAPTLDTLRWLVQNGFQTSIAGRYHQESRPQAIENYTRLLSRHQITLDLEHGFTLFPEMDERKDTPEITTECWSLLDKKPEDQMCASERMVIKRKGSQTSQVVPCTLLAYDPSFELGETLTESLDKTVYLNHPFCAQFCVLGGARCSERLV